MTFGSLFAGIGGFDLGFERAGMRCIWQVEIDEYCRRVLAKHWPDVRRHDDVRTWPVADTERPDVICGGFPCQDISYAGKGAGLSGERSGLWFQFARIVREMAPRFVVVENVAALLARGLDAVLGTLADCGYDAEWDCISASSVGAPHRRDRIWIVAYPKSNGRPRRRNGNENANLDSSCQKPLRSKPPRNRAVCGTSDLADAKGIGLQRERAAREQEPEALGRPRIFVGRSSLPSEWATEPNVGRVANGIPKRVDRLKGLGNAVVPQVAEFIGRRLMEASA